MNTNLIRSIILPITLLVLAAGGLQAQIITNGVFPGDLQINGTTGTAATKPNLLVTGGGGVIFSAAYGAGITPQATVNGSMFIWNPYAAALRMGYYDNLTLANTASNYGQYSFAGGYDAIASGQGSFAFGSNAMASQMSCVAIGSGAQATGTVSYALGANALATGAASLALGTGTQAVGGGSRAIGQGTIANSNFCTVVGSNNITDTLDSPGTWVTTSPIFVVGNGIVGPPPVVRSNAFVIYKNGNAVFTPPAGSATPPAGTPSTTVTAPGFVISTPGGCGDIPMYTGN